MFWVGENMQCIKDVLEIIYYIAFIVLTGLIVKYAKQTYVLQSRKDSKLLCKIFVDTLNIDNTFFPFYLEIYNFGNEVSKDIEVSLLENQLFKVDFIKPNESCYIPVGNVIQTLGGNRVMLLDDEIMQEDSLIVRIKMLKEKTSMIFDLNTSILFASKSMESGSDKIVDAIKDTTRAIEKISR